MDAIDNLSDAIDTTRNFLTPIRLGMWLKLAIVVFFVSSLGFGGPTIPGGDFGTFADDPAFEDGQAEEFEDEFGEEFPLEELILGLLIIGGIILVFWLLYAIIAGIMEFVFLESLRESEVHVRRYFSGNLGNGVRLFGFRLGIMLVAGVLGTAPAAAIYLQGGLGDLSGGLIGLYALYGIGLYLVYSIVRRFTTDFVAPIMLLENRGVIGSWKRFWSTGTGNWAEYAVYLILVWILSLAISIAAVFVVMFGMLALAIPFGIVIFLLIMLGDIGVLLAVLVGVIAFVVMLLFVALVWTPITTYFRYYALLLLGDTNAEFDLIPDQRAAVRSDGGEPTDDGRWDRDGRDEYDDRQPSDSATDADRDDRRPDDRDSRDDTSSTWDDNSSAWDDLTEADDDDEDDENRGW
ncbi:hypothetical protein GS429_19400 [Natronorubrum sp. JWXQ-INN-674]|uniref:Membrane domain of glycerophosphoryl diester phosphodiesterase n=1 Tax=Natronorubrum halalkaliphilum TaxID=2691917 RepID=A0A6B0VTV7_9EURY|nr:hypothetical protein [Natronorubrum halalkaliphilum]MXV64192.1 hypothetical protein [Natronorubrum halalkaliphilum]